MAEDDGRETNCFVAAGRPQGDIGAGRSSARVPARGAHHHRVPTAGFLADDRFVRLPVRLCVRGPDSHIGKSCLL